MPRKSFDRMNEEQERLGRPKYANPRNAGAGSVRVLDPNITASRNLEFYSYFLLVNGRPYFDQHSESLKALTAAGFKVNPNWRPMKNIEGVLAYINEWESKREGARLRDRWRRDQGELHWSAERAGLHRQSAALGDRLQVGGAVGRDADRKHRRAGWPHRQADAGRVAEAGVHWRDDRHSRDAAQRR